MSTRHKNVSPEHNLAPRKNFSPRRPIVILKNKIVDNSPTEKNKNILKLDVNKN